MSDYGQLQAVIVDPKGTALSTAASSGDTELVVDNAQDFDVDGGTLDLNGARLAYTGITEGANADDPDTILLAGSLPADADENDAVSPVVGGLIPEDWYGVVTMGDEGDEVHVPLSVDQRAQWVPGEYPDPVPVAVSDDMQQLIDAPGRTVSSRNAFLNTDSVTWPGSPDTVTLPLTKPPISGSEHAYWKASAAVVGGLALPPGSWHIDGGSNLIIDDSGLIAEFGAGDLFWVDYAYDAAAADISRPVHGPLGPTLLEWDSTGTWIVDGGTIVGTDPLGDDDPTTYVDAFSVSPPDDFFVADYPTGTAAQQALSLTHGVVLPKLAPIQYYSPPSGHVYLWAELDVTISATLGADDFGAYAMYPQLFTAGAYPATEILDTVGGSAPGDSFPDSYDLAGLPTDYTVNLLQIFDAGTGPLQNFLDALAAGDAAFFFNANLNVAAGDATPPDTFQNRVRPIAVRVRKYKLTVTGLWDVPPTS